MYRTAGAGPALQDVVAGNIDLVFDNHPTLATATSGKHQAYAVIVKKRLASLPDTPSLDEAGRDRVRHLGLERDLGTEGYAEGCHRELNVAVVDALATQTSELDWRTRARASRA